METLFLTSFVIFLCLSSLIQFSMLLLVLVVLRQCFRFPKILPSTKLLEEEPVIALDEEEQDRIQWELEQKEKLKE